MPMRNCNLRPCLMPGADAGKEGYRRSEKRELSSSRRWLSPRRAAPGAPRAPHMSRACLSVAICDGHDQIVTTTSCPRRHASQHAPRPLIASQIVRPEMEAPLSEEEEQVAGDLLLHTLLPFQREIIAQLIEEDGLCILAQGLGWHQIAAVFLRLQEVRLRRPGNRGVVLVLGATGAACLLFKTACLLLPATPVVSLAPCLLSQDAASREAI